MIIKKETVSIRVQVNGSGSTETDMQRLLILADQFNSLNLNIVTPEEGLGQDQLDIVLERAEGCTGAEADFDDAADKLGQMFPD